jgi:creatinine amidohydrolase
MFPAEPRTRYDRLTFMSIQHLGTMTWREVKEFIHERVVALIPLGSMVAHGPHLPLNTDVVLSTEMVRRAARRLATKGRDVLIYPPISYSPAGSGASFAGTVNIASEVFGTVLRSLLAQIGAMGIRTAALVSSHVDPEHLLTVHSSIKAAAGSFGLEDMRIVFPMLLKEPWVSRLPEEFRRGGAHGGQVETSCMMALQADKIREDVRKKLAKVDADLTTAFRDGKKTFEQCGGSQAYFGNPAAATAADGEKYLDLLGDIVADAVLEEKA